MADSAGTGSPRELARLTGALYLFIMVAAMFAEGFVRDRLIVGGDAAATTRNILASEGLWRWGVAADVGVTLCDVAVAALLYVLLRPVSRTGSASAAFFRLAYSASIAVGGGFLAVPLVLLGHPAPDPALTQALVLYSVRLHAALFDVALVLFGVHLVLVGGLIVRSTFLPRVIGAGLAIAGLCYVANSVLGWVAPGVSSGLFPWILLPGFIAEGALTLWLLIVGVDPRRWAEQAAA